MATWLFGKVMDKLINNGLEYLQKQFTWRTDMKNKLERLRDNQPKIQAIVSAASQAQIIDQNPALNKWIWQLQDAIDEVDDLFDEIEYIKHQQQLDRNKEDTKVRSYWSNISNPAKRLRVGNEDTLDLKKLEELVQKLDNILAGASVFLHLLDFKKQEEQLVELRKTRETGFLPRNDLIGRDKDKDKVINWLREPSNEEYQTHVTTTVLYHNISILSIVGHGGMGKTTLLQHVYANEMTKEFDLKMWVCVSDSFDVKKVIADMLGYVTDRSCLQSLAILQESLKSKVMSKKILLILDDIWDKEKGEVLLSKLEDVLVPLASGGLGSKILITTRMDSVASIISKVIGKKKTALTLKGLEEGECLQLLTTHAFVDAENPDDHKKLISIAQELVKKLFGSPLAAKVMGGVLSSSLDERHWRNVLNNNLELTDVFSILKLSYIFLPQHLQSCFSFCSIFKQDHLFNKEDLVRMWIAVGFIQPSHNNQGDALTLEDIGESYFDVLIKKSFFNKVSYHNGYKMHDLLHELAQSVSTQECFRFVGDEKPRFLEIPKTIRHLSIETNNPEVLKSVGRFKNLKTLHITDEYDSNLFDVLVENFKVIRSIRLLHLNYSFELKMIPEEIAYLQHLRYLRYSALNVKQLPRSLSTLYQLQFIIFDNYENFLSKDYFPRDMNNLFNLRYLSDLKFPGIGMLKFLQKLEKFKIKNEKGYRIEELEHMNELRSLKISNLKDVRVAEEANNAKLCDKRKLIHLSLKWDHVERGNADLDLDERVLDNLQPPNNIKKLWVYSYMGARSAIWMNDAHLINNLQEIYLSHCLEWEILPPFGLLPFLKTLWLFNMPKVKRLENKFHGNDMCCVFPSLQRLSIMEMEALVDWFDASVVDGLFPSLTKLKLFYCPNLQELPYLPPKLESLEIENIGWKSLNCCSISTSIPLKELEVRRCRNITSISVEGEIGKLEKLVIEDLQSLQTLPCSLRNIISSLEFVEMGKLPQLQEYPDLPLPLKKMKIKKPKLHLEVAMFLTIENDHGIEELEHMNEIRFLHICNLKNVKDAKEAFNAKLCEKRKLIHLSLKWDHVERGNADPDLDERVLDSLQPHNYLMKLDIFYYMGARSAIWMNDAHLINNLQEIQLLCCWEWEILPPFGQLPFLKTLKLNYMPKVKRLENKFHGNDACCVFPSLQYLSFASMDALVDWFDASVVDGLFPCLTKLYLSNCPNLQELPYLPPKLESLEIENIGWKTLNCCSISRSIPLETLEVRHCENIRSISLKGEIGKLGNVRIEDLPSLQSFPSSLANISSLKFLKLSKLPQLQKYPDPYVLNK